MTIAYPSPGTLHKYGLTLDDFKRILEAQGGICPICGKVPNPSKRDGKIRWVVDHYHRRGWKQLPPEKRKQFVRGICCWFCNKYYLGKAITVEKSKNVTAYLERFENKLERTTSEYDKENSFNT